MRKGCKVSERRVHFERHFGCLRKYALPRASESFGGSIAFTQKLPLVSYLQKSRLGSARLRKGWRDGNNEIRNKTGKLMNCPV
ncbi:unnamed protein product [Acanthoscelides obtectus]|uniref:Uncharacterized protein n=1 Tax=Acanthoscelides obtectus TaxID=200917 RepID=A0A9P0Q3A6_ACAOB|nr:unnamed protein product [Acanthoscelides obtectus]CAK1627212.1 hypothetical protein AOBTE_LOCUS4395 [Acanthoscelides obtectus]